MATGRAVHDEIESTHVHRHHGQSVSADLRDVFHRVRRPGESFHRGAAAEVGDASVEHAAWDRVFGVRLLLRYLSGGQWLSWRPDRTTPDAGVLGHPMG